MNLKELKESKFELLDEMENLTKDITVFNSVRFEEMKNELEDVNNKISEFENNSTKIKDIEKRKESGNRMKLKDLLLQNKTVDLSKMVINNEGEMVRTGNEAVLHETVQDTIEKRVEEKCHLFAKIRKVRTSAPHAITIQAEKLDKFLNVKEMAEYQRKAPNYKQVVLGAEKYGLVVVLSQELIDDALFDMEREINDQLVEAMGKTVEDLIVNGDSANGVEGLLMAEEAVKVQGKVGYELLVDMIFGLRGEHRKDGVFVMGDDVARKIMGMTDQAGRPLLDMNVKPLRADGDVHQILGHDVIISPCMPEGKAIFANLDKALVMAVRKDLQVKKSEEVMFLVDGVAIKGNIRVDAKILDPKAIVIAEIQE